MTQQELSQHFELRWVFQRDRALLESLEATERACCYNLSTEIADMRKHAAEVQQGLEREEVKVKNYITQIPDNYLRTIFSLRYLSGLSWEEIAAAIGGGNTPAAAKKMCSRYLAKQVGK